MVQEYAQEVLRTVGDRAYLITSFTVNPTTGGANTTFYTVRDGAGTDTAGTDAAGGASTTNGATHLYRPFELITWANPLYLPRGKALILRTTTAGAPAAAMDGVYQITYTEVE